MQSGLFHLRCAIHAMQSMLCIFEVHSLVEMAVAVCGSKQIHQHNSICVPLETVPISLQRFIDSEYQCLGLCEPSRATQGLGANFVANNFVFVVQGTIDL